MKRHLLVLSALFISCLLYAQKSYTKHEFFISYGVFPVINEPFDMPVNEVTGPGSIEGGAGAMGCVQAGVKFKF